MLTSGEVLQSRYRIRRQIGGGGMGSVYLAEDTRLSGRQCAIKEMSPAELAPSDRNWSIQAFRQEAQMLANLDHRGLTRVTDFFPEGGNWYLVMDFVAGETFEVRLMRAPEGRLPIDRALHITRQLCDVLTYLHNRQPPVIFRDLKPGNIMLTPNDEVKLIDFGIARFFKPGKTQDTVLLGTPGYAAPEQYGGLGQSDPRTDVYSLGALLHHMITGHDPTTGATPFSLPDPYSVLPSIPSRIADVIAQATRPQPASRYPTVQAMRNDLFKTSNEPPSAPLSPPQPQRKDHKKRTFAFIAIGAGTILMLCLGSMLFLNHLRQAPVPSSTPAETRITETPQDAGVMDATDTVVPIATSTPAPTLADTPSPIAPVSVDAISIPAGEFIRGSTRNHIRSVADHLCSAYSDSWCSQEHFEDELPIAEVDNRASGIHYLNSNIIHVDTFLIDPYEVTNGAYARCVAAGVCDPPERNGPNPRHRYLDDLAHANYPVIYVSAEDAATYCRWVGGRLPRADEWEKAARGTEGNIWPWGNRSPSNELNFRHPGHRSATEEDTSLKGNDVQPVGSYPGDVSPYGVYDMAGNVMEWTGSMYGPGKQEIRGGSWNTGSYTTRTANRVGAEPDRTYFDVGFRCAYEASP